MVSSIHIVWYSENMEEKQLSFIQRPKLSKIIQFMQSPLVRWYLNA